MTSTTALSVRDVSKKYKLFSSTQDRLWEALHPFQKVYHQEFWALKNVNFELERGNTLGIVGRNGSGKSTLLQIISSVLQPTTGEVEINGRVAALLELGAGFNPEFTGRENVIFNGALMGFSQKEMEERLPWIENFAEIGAFFNHPVKTYSSGMFTRLAFAAAIHVEPDILIIDEALSVGDAKFQHKCFQKFHDLQQKDRTIIFVSHDTNLILKHCNQALFIENGTILENGHPKDVVNSYLNFIMTGYLGEAEAKKEDEILEQEKEPDLNPSNIQIELEQFLNHVPEEDQSVHRPSYNSNEYRLGDRKASIIDYLLVAEGKTEPSSIRCGSLLEIYLKARFHQDVEAPMFGFALKTVDGVMISGNNSRFSQIHLQSASANDIVVFRFTLKLNLQPGDYFIDLGVAEKMPMQDNLMDVRNSMIHIHVGYKNQFNGWVDLQLSSEEIKRLNEPKQSLV